MSEKLRAGVSLEHWSGHGEGGTIARVVISGGYRGNPYNSTPEDITVLHAQAGYINDALQAHETWAPVLASVKADRDKAYARLGWCTGCDFTALACLRAGVTGKCCPDCSHTVASALLSAFLP